jgi:L-alanine-DL-glutamate epimerase-like enolase superfamily enzyme
VPYYGLSAGEVEADLWQGLESLGEDDVLGQVPPWEGRALEAFRHPVGRSAFVSACLGLRAALGLEGAGLPALVGLGSGLGLPTSYTVAYDDDPGAMVAVARACGFDRLKVKAGIPGDIERITSLRQALPKAILRVDANQGWSHEEAPGKLAALEALGVELVEEPIKGSPADFEALASATALPILLDESVRNAADVRRFAQEAPSVAGIVVKTAKNGGPLASLALAQAALEAGQRVMLSCMVETSLGVGAALPLASLATWLDLDAPLLLSEDPFVGLGYVEQCPGLKAGGIRPGKGLEDLIAGLAPRALGA